MSNESSHSPSEPIYEPAVSEGMWHGPIAPPELDSQPVSSQWVLNQSQGDMEVYRLRMLQETLYQQRRDRQIEPEIFRNNMQRLDNDIARTITQKNWPAYTEVIERVTPPEPPSRRAPYRKRRTS